MKLDNGPVPKMFVPISEQMIYNGDIEIETIFGKNMPLLTGNKWKIGHTFGASGAMSLEMALLMLKHDQFIQVPYLPLQKQSKSLQKILINAAGFGGTAFSILVENNPQN